MTKKIFTITICLLLLCTALAGCKGDKAEETTAATETTEAETTEATTTPVETTEE